MWEPSPLVEAGRSTYVRSTRKVYRDRQAMGAPGPKDEMEVAIDAMLRRLVRDFDFSFVYSGDSSLARLAADDFYQEVLFVSRIEGFNEGAVLKRWRELYESWERSSSGFQAKLRSLVRSGRRTFA